MPVTKLSSGKCSGIMLRYLTKENEAGIRVRAIGGNLACKDWQSAEREFRATRDQYAAHGGTQYHHASVSFDQRDMGILAGPDGKPNYSKLVEFGEKWAERNGIAARHQFLVVVHGDKPHPHVHICWNSVAHADGKKWHSDRAFLERARDTTDYLARKYEVRAQPSRERNPLSPPDKVLRAVARGADPYSWKVDLRLRIADAARSAVHEEDFKKKLAQRGVELRQRGEGYSYSFRDLSGQLRVARARRLGEEYQRGSLLEKLEVQRKDLLRGPRAAEGFSKRMLQEQGRPLQSWRQELRRHLSEVRQVATGMQDYRDQLASRGIMFERDAAGDHYTFTAKDGQPHRMEGRALGPAYSEERLSARFADNDRAPITLGVSIVSRAAANVGGLAERLAAEIERESRPGYSESHEYKRRPRRRSGWDEHENHERF